MRRYTNNLASRFVRGDKVPPQGRSAYYDDGDDDYYAIIIIIIVIIYTDK